MEEKMILHCYCFTSELIHDMLTCIACHRRFHLSCLKSGRPSHLAGDVYFHFTCQTCSLNGMEIIKRKKLQWTLVIMIALYNLQLQGDSKYGYFRWREQICRFIDKNWAVFFGEERKKTATWHSTVAGALSSGANRFFVSGMSELGENGWWSLKYSKLPSLEELDSFALNIKTSIKCEVPSKVEISPFVEGPRKKDLRVEAVVAMKEKKAGIVSHLKYPKSKKKRLVSKEKAVDSSNLSFQHKLKFVVSQPGVSNFAHLQNENSKQNVPKIIINKGKDSVPAFPTNDLNMWVKESQERLNLNQISIKANNTPNSLDNSINLPSVIDAVITDMSEKKEYESEEENSNSSKTISTANEFYPSPACKLKVATKDENLIKKAIDDSKLVLMSPFEEDQLLKKLQKYSTAMKDKPELRRLYRKIVVRQLQRERKLQVFDIDAKVRSLKGMDTPSYMEHEKSQKKVVLMPRLGIILDRFQIGKSNAQGKSQQHISFMTRLMGLGNEGETSFVSPYTERILKPFIYRDYNIKPLKMKLLEEVLHVTNKNNPNWIPPKQSPIDYRYVRPQYIPVINALCHEFFWPGIDMSECLQYPDFSCIALYKKLIIGFAFIVPDVKYNEAYVTFIFCHPEWRRSGIGSYMLYHLIQTCMGKDVTLHVSASSAAVTLYQGMGFEVEEVIYDFYDKYLPPDSKECRHALFLRLSR